MDYQVKFSQKPCKFFNKNTCIYGPFCPFVHDKLCPLEQFYRHILNGLDGKFKLIIQIDSEWQTYNGQVMIKTVKQQHQTYFKLDNWPDLFNLKQFLDKFNCKNVNELPLIVNDIPIKQIINYPNTIDNIVKIKKLKTDINDLKNKLVHLEDKINNDNFSSLKVFTAEQYLRRLGDSKSSKEEILKYNQVIAEYGSEKNIPIKKLDDGTLIFCEDDYDILLKGLLLLYHSMDKK